MVTRRPVVVVGGGTAGSVLIAHLAAATTREIIVVEPGPVSDMDDEPRFLEIPKHSNLLESVQVRQVEGGSFSGYSQARALGGGSAVNGLLLSGDEPDYVRGLTRLAQQADMGPMSRALLDEGGRPSRLWWNGGRWNPGRALAHLIEEGRVQWVNLAASGIDCGHDHPVVSVVTHDIVADSVVMSAGAIRTPEVLLRSGLDAVSPRIGEGLQNHPTITIAFELNESPRSPFDATVVRDLATASGGRALVVAYERASWTEPDLGLLSVSLMDPTSQGRVGLDGDESIVEFNMLATEEDVVGMRSAVRGLFDIARSPGFSRISSAVHADSAGTPLDDVRALSDSETDAWIRRSLQPVSHAAASCRHAVIPNGRLGGVRGVWVADASGLQGIPSVTPAAPVTMEALRVARALGKELE